MTCLRPFPGIAVPTPLKPGEDPADILCGGASAVAFIFFHAPEPQPQHAELGKRVDWRDYLLDA
ncbi:hypothetical protein [Pseudomonas sp. Marseille-QA0892]